MIASALFIDGKLDRWLANRWTKHPCFQLLRLQDGEAVASRKGSISSQYGREIAFLEPRYDPESFRNPNSLAGTGIFLLRHSAGAKATAKSALATEAPAKVSELPAAQPTVSQRAAALRRQAILVRRHRARRRRTDILSGRYSVKVLPRPGTAQLYLAAEQVRQAAADC
jgi:hypothetical protein